MVTFQEDLDYARAEERKEKLAERKAKAKERIAKASELRQKLAKKVIGTFTPSKETYRDIGKAVTKVFIPSKKANAQLKAQRAYQLKMAKLKHKQRMEQIKAQQEAASAQQDPRFQPSSDEQFLSEPDQIHEMNVDRAQQEEELQPYTQEQSAHFTSRFKTFSLRNLFNRVALFNQRRGARQGDLRGLPPELADQMRRAQNPAAGPATILNAENRLMPMNPNINKINLMQSEKTKPRAPPINAPRLKFWKA